MSENPDSVPPPAKDPRPRPQYGELAPEGWAWQPPEDKDRVDADPTPDPAPAVADGVGSGAGAPPPADPTIAPAAPPGQSKRPVPGWDRPLTIGLLTFGLLATLYGAFSLGALPDAMQMIYTQQGIGTYTPTAAIGPITSIGAIALVFIWLVATTVSVRLLLRRRRAFYIPVIGGALSTVTMFAFMLVAMLSDPTLIEFLSRQ
jgi:hypothetical protein